MLKRELYKVEGERIVRLRRNCPKCGDGVFLAEHKNRLSCGQCGYTEFKGKREKPLEPKKEEAIEKPVMEEKVSEEKTESKEEVTEKPEGEEKPVEETPAPKEEGAETSTEEKKEEPSKETPEHKEEDAEKTEIEKKTTDKKPEQ